MRWWRRLRVVWPFGTHRASAEASAAVQSAELSHVQAVSDRVRAAAVRAEAEHWTSEMRAHNAANRYDSLLARIMFGEDR